MALDAGDHASSDNKKRIGSRWSRKTLFALMTGLSILGLLFVTFGTNIFSPGTFNYLFFSNMSDTRHAAILKYLWTWGDSNSFNRTLSEKKIQLLNVSSDGVTSIIVNTSALPKAPIITTQMTFNKSFTVACKESPFIECAPPIVKMEKGKVFKVSLMKTPKWHTKPSLNISLCRYNQCRFVYDTMPNDTDLVVVYGVYLGDSYKLPARSGNHLYAASFWEPPIYTHSDYIKHENSTWNNQFNLTINYRVDSDIFSPYTDLRFSPIPVNQRPNYYDIARNKTKTAFLLSSHCHTQSKREYYVNEMQKYVDVDIYGGCGKPCPTRGFTCGNLSTKYKFYLAFENSLCHDYITEKFFKFYTQDTHIIPVVRGGSDYSKYFANYTYINSADFKTAKDLAFFLKNLASDLDTYSKYLEYKDLYVKGPFLIDFLCRICQYLHTHADYGNKIYNLKKWSLDGHCFSPHDF